LKFAQRTHDWSEHSHPEAKAKGLSQEALALESNIATSYVGGVERGQRNPSFKKLCAIGRVIGRDLGSLCRGLPLPGDNL